MAKYTDILVDTVMRRYPDPDSFPYRSWSYPQGFLLWGFIRLYEKTGDKKYYDYALAYCDGHVSADGTISGFSGNSMDDIMAGSVLVWAYTVTKQEKYKLACDNVRRAFDDYPRNSDGGFWHGRGSKNQMWVDGVFMGQMFLVRYGKYIGDSEYCFSEAVKQLTVIFDRCEKDDSGLLYHAYCEGSRVSWAHRITGKSHEIWCEGLGWYALILADALELIPSDFPGYDRLVMQFRKLHNGLAIVQDKTSGLWYQVVDKPRHPRNWHDTSGSAMFTYSMYKGVKLGILGDDRPYQRIAERGFDGLKTKFVVGPDGNADLWDACDGLCVQEYYDIYVDYMRNLNSKECIAAFLWASAALEYGCV